MAQQTVKRGVESIQWLLSVAGAACFAAGYITAVIGGIWWPDNAGLIATLVIMGVIVGLLNITSREIMPYLVAAIALVLVGNTEAFTPLNQVAIGLGDRVNEIVRMMAIFTAPAAVIQAVRAGVVLAKPG
ncbi:MAG: hypothetical protein HYU29_03670 [Chloroflexi bacterium]|nr:hypothetical protein [Chloroflexota bacterium]